MKRGSYKVTLAILMMLMFLTLTGCSKNDNDQAKQSDTPGQEVTETQSTVDDTAEDKDDQGTEQATVAPDSQEAAESTGAEDKSTTEQETADEIGLKDVYGQAGIKAGTCLSVAMIYDSKYTDLITKNFNSVTLENFMKPDSLLDKAASIAAGDIVVKFTAKTTAQLDWAMKNGMLLRGHVLVWYSQTPDWIFYENFDVTKPLVDRDTMLARMESYIKQTFEQLSSLGYADSFYAYDVVNEAIMEDGTYRDCLWKQIIGDDYIWNAFKFADQYAPDNIKLYYNDYNEQFKTQHLIKLAQSLVDENGNTLIDGIGCQGHLYTQDSIDDYINTLKALSALGLDVQITELDVSLGTWQNILPATEENLKAQGQYYYELINRIITENAAGNTKVSGITYWGFADNLSWRHDRNPLLFDKDLNPKYAYYGAIQDREKAGY